MKIGPHIDNVTASLDAFLDNPSQHVLLIRGAWGTGKTFLWNRYAESRKNIAQKRIRYVSAFGVQSILELKQKIAYSKQLENVIGKVPDVSVGVPIPYVPFKINFGVLKQLITSASITFAGHSLICIDDIERKEKGLTLKALFGLVSDLVSMECKVVLISNDNELEDADKEYLKMANERIVDAQIELLTSSAFVCEHTFETTNIAHETASKVLEAFQVQNFRIAQRIKGVVDTVSGKKDMKDEIKERLSLHASVVGCSFFGVKTAPSEDLVVNFTVDGFGAYLYPDKGIWATKAEPNDSETEESEQNRAYAETLFELGFFYDDLSRVVHEFLRTGVLDWKRYDAAFKRIDQEVGQEQIATELRAIWDLYGKSFYTDQVTFCGEMSAYLQNHVNEIGSTSFSQACSFLAELDHVIPENVRRLNYSSYLDRIGDGLEDLQWRRFDNHELPNDPLFKTLMDERITTLNLKLSIPEAMKILLTNYAHVGALNKCNSLSADEIYNWLVSDQFEESSVLTRKFVKEMETVEKCRQYYDNLIEALRRLAKRSKIDAKRVQLIYGVTV